MNNLFFRLGALFALLSVAAGAFGAHALRSVLEPAALEIFQTAARYQMYHALALLVVGVLDKPKHRWTGWCFVVGIVLFSGSLYALSITGITILGIITPLGGLAWLVGWGLLVWSGR